MKKLISAVAVVASAVIGGSVYAQSIPVDATNITLGHKTVYDIATSGDKHKIVYPAGPDGRVVVNNNPLDDNLTTQGYVDKQVGGVNTRVDGLQTQVNALGSRINEVERNANAGIAGVAAMSQIQVAPGKDFAVGAGVGTYRGQSAVAIGAAARLNENLHVRAGFSSTGVVAAGATYSW